MKWTTPTDIRALALKWWDRGDLLARVAGFQSEDPKQEFPRAIRLKTPTSTEISNNFDEVRKWIATFTTDCSPHFKLETRQINHRLFGKNTVPCEVRINDVDDAIRLIGKGRDANRFLKQVEFTCQAEPVLIAWLQRKPLQALALSEIWCQLLLVIEWMKLHPRPDVYIRQVDIAGVDSKFIEANRAVLGELFELCLPELAIDYTRTGSSQFAARYGFKEKPVRIRFRILDASKRILPTEPKSTPADITLDDSTFAVLCPDIRNVFIVENEINFLAFPNLPNSMVIFGSGYGFEGLAKAQWLHDCRIHYWGDIDTHGFAILNSLRSAFSHVESFLMDTETFCHHIKLAGIEDKPTSAQILQYLTPAENEVFQSLRFGEWRNKRLEQERIEWNYALESINTVQISTSMTHEPVTNDLQDFDELSQ